MPSLLATIRSKFGGSHQQLDGELLFNNVNVNAKKRQGYDGTPIMPRHNKMSLLGTPKKGRVRFRDMFRVRSALLAYF